MHRLVILDCSIDYKLFDFISVWGGLSIVNARSPFKIASRASWNSFEKSASPGNRAVCVLGRYCLGVNQGPVRGWLDFRLLRFGGRLECKTC
jgi:hypothetical protein